MSESVSPSAAPRRETETRGRDSILREAAGLVTLEGIEGLSIARLAAAVGLSKSGLFAHFRSKEELQLATLDMADRIFRAEVVEPALRAPTAVERLRALCEEFLSHLDRGVFPGGCFFASVAAEIDTHPGPVHDRALGIVAAWLDQLEAAARQAQVEGAVDPGEDAAQIAFELDAYLLLANAQYVASRSRQPLDRARHAIDRLLRAVSTTR
jgi:AcrR family transcriptional regulator